MSAPTTRRPSLAGPRAPGRAPAARRARRRGAVRRLQPAPVLPRRQHVLDHAAGRGLPAARRRRRRHRAGGQPARRHRHPARCRHQPGRADHRRRASCWTARGTCDRILDLDPEARTARVQLGVVQDELNRAAAPFGLMFGPDTSTSNRATIGGMFGNNSAGSGSLRYGMTIDHVRALDVVLSDGSRAVSRRSTRPSARGAPPPTRSRDGIYRRAARRSSRRTASAIETRVPAVLAPRLRLPARPAGRRLARSTWRRSSSAPRARWRSPPRPWSAWCPSRSTPSFAVGHFDTHAEGHRGDRRRAVLRPGPGRADGQDHPRPVPTEDRVRRPGPQPRRRPGGAAVRLVHRRRPGRGRCAGSTR